MTILALTKAHQSQVQQLFNDVDFFSAEWFSSPKQLFFSVFTQDHELTTVAHIELYHNVMILKALTTSKAYRNQGVARKLLKHTEHLAQKLGCDMIYAFTRYGANYLECAGFEQTIRSRLPLQLVDYMTNHQLNHSTIMKRKVELSKKHLMRQEQKALQTQMPLSHLVA